MDGVRAYWDGQFLMSKNGRLLPAPKNFTEGFPSIPLDGELWLGRKSYEDIVGAVQGESDLWKRIKFYVFDLPSSNETYESRIAALKQLTLPPNVSLVDIEVCQGNGHLRNRLHAVVKEGGEGLMLIQPKSLYITGRSSALLKVKVINILP